MHEPLPGFVMAAPSEPGSEPGTLQRFDGLFAPGGTWVSTRRMPGRWSFPDYSALYAKLFAGAALQMDQLRDERALGVAEFSTPRRRLGDLPPPPPVAD